MTEQKRYYWIKLKTDFFNQETVDLLLSQPNGCQYVVLYQMLCLNTANSDGEMATRVGEMIVPYNIDKIVRDTKYFDHDTVTVALELFKKLGLIYAEEDGVLRITDFVAMVGHESANREAVKKREYRLRKKIEMLEDGSVDKKVDKLSDRDRDQRLEYRDQSIDIELDKKESKKKSAKRFVAPSVEEVKQYCLERKNSVNPEQFVNFYAAKGWMVGKNKMKDWKACVRTWEQRDSGSKTQDSRYMRLEVDDDLPF